MPTTVPTRLEAQPVLPRPRENTGLFICIGKELSSELFSFLSNFFHLPFPLLTISIWLNIGFFYYRIRGTVGPNVIDSVYVS